MKILMINSVCGIGSTGRICTDLATAFEKKGDQVKIAYGREGYVPEEFRRFAVRIGTDRDVKFHALKTRLTDRHGLGSKGATKRFLKWAEEFDPDLLWLHNLHGYYIHYGLLFRWIKSRPQMQVKWTLHDCWAFTGHCAYFSFANCNQWQTHCMHCPQKAQYPAAARDRAKENFESKKKAFTGVSNMNLIVPSQWLAGLVQKSFLREYPIEVRYNTVDTTVFHPVSSNFKQAHGLEDKIMVLGVANNWNQRKGLDDFKKLAGMIDKRYQIVLVGLSEQQIRELPKNILCFARTDRLQDLAEIYSAADVYFNASREETFGMTTLEAVSCGTPAIVYRGTACEEVAKKYGGIVVEPDVTAAYAAITELFFQPNRKKEFSK